MAVTGYVVAGLLLGLALIGARLLRSRSSSGEVQHVVVREAGEVGPPRFLPGRPALRMPHRIPRPVERIEAMGGNDGEG